MRKKHLLTLLAFFCLMGGSTWAQNDFIQGDLMYSILNYGDKTVSVRRSNNFTGGAIVIPATVTNGNVTYTVTTIAGSAFENTALTSISIPSTVKIIEGWAFSSTNLTRITIPASVDSIGERSFAYCPLTSINIEAGSKELKMINGYYGCFYDCNAEKTVFVGRDLKLSSESTVFGDNTTSVEFGDNVTAIQPNMFQYNHKLNNIKIGNGVKTIGHHAFNYCGTDENVGELVVTMGNNVTNIMGCAFEYCSKLKAITLPEKMDTIFAYAFSSTGLTSITIPASVDSIGERSFANCPLTSINIKASSKELKMINGHYGCFYDCNAEKTVFVGRELKLSNESTVFGDNTTSVEFGDNVTAIQPNLFQYNHKLSNIKIGSGVKTIGHHAFIQCGTDENVGELVVTMGNNVTDIMGSAFENCSTLKAITLPEKLDTIFGYAFSSTGLTSITIPASVDSIGERSFAYCPLTSINIEASSKELKMINAYYGCFYDCNAEKTVFVGRELKLSNESTVFGDNTTSVEFGDNVTAIQPNMFQYNHKLNNIKIGNGVKTIGHDSFNYCGSDENVGELVVTMGSNVETIGERAFGECSTLKAVTLPSTLKLIEGDAFQSSGLTSITIPASVDSIGSTAFGWCHSLASIRIEDSSKELKIMNDYYGSFKLGNAEKTVYLGRDLKFNSESTVFGDNTTSVEFGDNVTAIQPHMFQSNYKLSNIKIGSGVKTIGHDAFWQCGRDEGVQELALTMGSNVETIGERAFSECSTLKAVTLPSTLKLIEGDAFQSSGLTSITIPASVDSIGSTAFGWCHSLASIRIEDSSKELKIMNDYYGSFKLGDAEKTVYLGRNLSYEDMSCVFPNITEVEIGKDVTRLNEKELNSESLVGTVKVPWTTPISIQSSVFSNNSYNKATLFVPGGTRAAYEDDAVWSKFLTMEASSYFVTGTATKGGTLKFEGETVTDGSKKLLVDREKDVVFEMIPDAYYDFTSLSVNGVAVNIAGRVYTYPNLLQDIEVKATFTEKPKFDIVASATGGTVSLNGTTPSASQTVKAYRDTNVTLTVAPAEGYQQQPAQVTVNGTDVTRQLRNNTLTIENIQEAKTIVVTFAKQQFPISIAQIQNGTIELSKRSVEWGGSFTATFKPATGYELASAAVNGIDVTAQVVNNVLTVSNVKEAKTISATFKKLKFQIAAEQTQNGSIVLSATTVEWGDRFTATFRPATGYELATATVNGQDFTASVSNNMLVVSNVQENKTVGATFQKKTYTVTVSGAIAVSNTKPLYGDNVTVTIEDDPDRTLVSLLVNGQDVTAQVVNGQYIITNITENVLVEATFKSTKEFITMTEENMLFSCPQDLDFSNSDLGAYIASGLNLETREVLLTRVVDVPAGTGIILYGTPGQTYKIPYAESHSVYMNFFKANLTTSTIPATENGYTNYVLETRDGEKAFWPASGSTTYAAQTAYLQVPTKFSESGVKLNILFEEDLIDGLDGFIMAGQDNEAIYDIAGRRLGKPQKGINIINGKKVLVK